MRRFWADLGTALRPLLPERWRRDTPVVPVVRLTGTIGMPSPLRSTLTLASVGRLLEKAFAMRHAKAVALIVNSPGGSPVQSHLIYLRIRSLAAEHNKPVLAFVEDAAASGGYMIACAADEIIADPSSIVGSIGVVGGSFGFDKLIAKIGVDRRIYTAGEHKVMLDPFMPENPDDVARLKSIQQEIHQSFIALVKASRGVRLTGPDDAVFSGEFWTGVKARDWGLVDAVGDLRSTLRSRFGDKVRTPVVAERGLFSRKLPGIGLAGAPSAPGGWAEEAIAVLEAKALWSRYGL